MYRGEGWFTSSLTIHKAGGDRIVCMMVRFCSSPSTDNVATRAARAIRGQAAARRSRTRSTIDLLSAGHAVAHFEHILPQELENEMIVCSVVRG